PRPYSPPAETAPRRTRENDRGASSGTRRWRAPSVRDGDFARKNRPRPRQQAAPREIAEIREEAPENPRPHRRERPRQGKKSPREPENRLPHTRRPHRSIEVPPLAPFAFRRRPHARQPPDRAQAPHRSRDRQGPRVVDPAPPPRRR